MEVKEGGTEKGKEVGKLREKRQGERGKEGENGG